MADSSAIQALTDRATAANNSGDIVSWVVLFENRAVHMPPGSPEVTTVIVSSAWIQPCVWGGVEAHAIDIAGSPS